MVANLTPRRGDRQAQPSQGEADFVPAAETDPGPWSQHSEIRLMASRACCSTNVGAIKGLDGDESPPESSG